jgi:hypothetical protein
LLAFLFAVASRLFLLVSASHDLILLLLLEFLLLLAHFLYCKLPSCCDFAIAGLPATAGVPAVYVAAAGVLKGTVPRDFRLLVFFMNQFPPSP